MNYAPDCADCPTPADCALKNDCQVMRKIRHGRAEIEFFVPPVALPLAQGTPKYQAGENLGEDVKFAFARVNQLEAENAALSAQVVELQKDAQWAKNELLEIMRIVGSALDQEDDITRLMKLHGIRLLVDADHVKYEALLGDAAKAAS